MPRRASRFRNRVDDERGQTLILVVAAMVVIIAMAAFAVDVAGWYQKRHQAQVSADSAALAAANCLAYQKCGSTTTGGDAYTTATNYASTNGIPASSVTIGGGYVTVTTSTTAPGSFVNLGFLPTPKASAVASYDIQHVPGSLFAQDCTNPTLTQPVTSAGCTVDPSCPAGISIKVNGQTDITGALQTNGSLNISVGGGGYVGDMIYGDPAGPNCGPPATTVSASNNTSSYGPAQEETAFAPFPETFNTATASSNCTPPSTYLSSPYPGFGNISSTNGTVTITGDIGSASTPVTICATSILVSKTSQATDVTLSAASIELKAALTLSPNPNDTPDSGQAGLALGIYSSATSGTGLKIDNSANGTAISGAVYAPASNIDMEGNNGGISFWEANTITFNGNNSAGGPIFTVPGLGSDFLTQ
jgi:Flp pilus assembly protein TadG